MRNGSSLFILESSLSTRKDSTAQEALCKTFNYLPVIVSLILLRSAIAICETVDSVLK